MIIWLFGPPVIMVLFARHRLHAGLSVFLIFIFYSIIAFFPLGAMFPGGIMSSEGEVPFLLSWALASALPLILLLVAPAKAISRRLLFLAIGLLLLIALNELSKLGIDLTAPKLQG
jgi:hypothetical protein